MLRKVLIANRGEVALRILRACKELGVETVLIHSEADKDSLPVRLADQSLCIGPGDPAQSYLSIPKIIQAAYLTSADSIHPGYGFLSENPEFANMVEKAGLKFVGPKAESIELLGDKERARLLMIEEGIPVVPGSDGPLRDIEDLKSCAKTMGYPLMIKAVSGGGGRGMRIIRSSDQLEPMFFSAQKEAEVAFGDDRLYAEKYIENGRHIEIQIMADSNGNVVHLGERDCSIQRKHQKLIEETPAINLDPKLRQQMIDSAVHIAQVTDYVGVGTVEFMVSADEYYFLEMNTRLQVEHTITEEVTGIDIVKEQLRIASGLSLSVTQEEVDFDGHAIQCRINAENVYEDFMPSFGTVEDLVVPGGFDVRFDSILYDGYTLPIFYDSMVGKLIVKGKTRLEAIKKMRAALEGFRLSGITTNRDLHYGIMHEFDFVRGRYSTTYLDEKTNTVFKNFLEEFGVLTDE